MASVHEVLARIHLCAWSITTTFILWALACLCFPPLHSSEALAVLIAGKFTWFGLNLANMRRLHRIPARALAMYLCSVFFEWKLGLPSLVGDTFFGMDSGVKRFDKGTSAYPVSIFERQFPPCRDPSIPESRRFHSCYYVRVAGARKQWESNGLYVNTGSCNGASHFECSNCIFTPLPQHLTSSIGGKCKCGWR